MTEAVYGSERQGPDLELAGQGRRLGAEILNAVLFAVTLAIGWLIWLLVVGQRGQDPAKQILGMHVVRSDGRRAGLGLMLLRAVVAKWAVFAAISFVLGLANEDVGGLVALAAYAVAALWCTWDANRQCLWDKALGTHVVHEGDAPAGARAISPTERAAENLQTLEDLHARGLLTDEEYEERRAREMERL